MRSLLNHPANKRRFHVEPLSADSEDAAICGLMSGCGCLFWAGVVWLLWCAV